MASYPKLLISGAAVSLGLGALVYYLSDDGKGPSEVSQNLRRDQVITILKELRKEFINVYMTIATFANSVKEQSGGRLPDNALKEILISQTPIPSFISKAETKVYDKYGITEQEFRLSVEYFQNSENEVQELIQEMKKNLEFAYKGVLPTDNTPIPDFLTPELTLTILLDIYDNGKYITYKQLSRIKASGIALNVQNEEFIKAVKEMETESENQKTLLFEKYGLTNYGENPAMLLRRAQQKFSAIDPGFREKMVILEEEYSTTMRMIMEDTIPTDEIQRLTNKYQ